MKKDDKEQIIKKEAPNTIFDVKNIGIADDFDDQLDDEQVIKNVRLGKPEPDDWFKLFPPKDSKLDSFLKGVNCKIKDAKNHKQDFLIGGSKAFKGETLKRIKPSSKTIITYGVTSTKMPFIWCVNYNDSYTNDWQKTAKQAADQACTLWTKIISDKPNEQNVVKRAAAQDQFPKIDIEKYPNYHKAIELAFEGRIINNQEHYAYKKSVGEIA